MAGIIKTANLYRGTVTTILHNGEEVRARIIDVGSSGTWSGHIVRFEIEDTGEIVGRDSIYWYDGIQPTLAEGEELDRNNR